MFNKETEYALRALVYIQLQNFSERRPGIVEIAKEIDAPQSFSAKILQRMVKQGVVKSLKGKGGGFFFDKEKDDLLIKDLVSLIGGNKLLTECGFGLKHCDCNNPCPLHDQYLPIKEAVNNLVSSESIQSLAKKYTKGLFIKTNNI